MDQTTDTADLLETEKYLNQVEQLSESDSDIEEEVAQDALLGGIRSGLRTITRTTREALSTCKNKTELDGAVQNIENSTLRLLRLEKSFLKTATIVSEVIDELVSDFEDDEENPPDTMPSSCDKQGSGDASIHAPHAEPYVFKLTQKNLASVANFKDKLTKEFRERLHNYESGLSENYLKEDQKFVTLLKQIKLGKKDAEKAMSSSSAKQDKNDEKDDTDPNITDPTSFLSMIPFSEEELRKHKYKPYDESENLDDSVLPTVDPITKELIVYPLRNKYCNHVFDSVSIYDYIDRYPEPKCPVYMCRNNRTLELNHFVSDPALTAHVRQKNFNCS